MRIYFGADTEGPFVSLSKGGRVVASERGAPFDDLLRLFERALTGAKVSQGALTEIAVDRGPGGFSAVRRRIAAAASLAYALGLPIAAVGHLSPEAAAKLPASRFRRGAAVAPKYDKPPNITKSKSVWKKAAKR